MAFSFSGLDRVPISPVRNHPLELARHLTSTESAGSALLSGLVTALTTTAKCKGRWRVLRRTCESDLSLYHRALVSEDQKASTALVMDETLSCVQSDIMAVHRHQMAMPKDESTSERTARCTW